LASNAAVHVSKTRPKALRMLLSFDYVRLRQARSWGNLPILNELKLRYASR